MITRLYNKVLAVLLTLSLLTVGCLALALVDEYHQVRISAPNYRYANGLVDQVHDAMPKEAMSPLSLKQQPTQAPRPLKKPHMMKASLQVQS